MVSQQVFVYEITQGVIAGDDYEVEPKAPQSHQPCRVGRGARRDPVARQPKADLVLLQRYNLAVAGAAHLAEFVRDAGLQPGDIDEALRTATAIGDDRLQKQAQGEVVPDAFTHGTSVQRVRWFRTGFEQGEVAGCDTFTATNL